jgi:hypothetical protein
MELPRRYQQASSPGDSSGRTGAWFQNGFFGAEVLWVPNRCKHTYEIVYPHELTMRPVSPLPKSTNPELKGTSSIGGY